MGLKIRVRKDTHEKNGRRKMICSGRSITTLIYIEGRDERGIYGKVHCFALARAVKYAGSGDLVMKLDQICDRIGPRAELEPHFLNRQMKEKYLECEQELPDSSDLTFLEEADEPRKIDSQHVQEFLQVTIQRRAYGSMQGYIRSRQADKGYVGFRSALELIRILELL